MQKYGPMELFDIVPTIQQKTNNQTKKTQARYYHFSDAQFRDGSKQGHHANSKQDHRCPPGQEERHQNLGS